MGAQLALSSVAAVVMKHLVLWAAGAQCLLGFTVTVYIHNISEGF